MNEAILMCSHIQASRLLTLAASVALVSAAIMPAAGAVSEGSGLTADAGAATAVPAVLSGDTWLRHLSEDLMPYWQTPDALGEPIGNYPTFLGRSGETLPDNTTRGLVALSRRVYGYSLAFMLTGNPKYLAYARAGLDWIEGHAVDTVHGGYFGQLDVNGNPVDSLANKDISDVAAVGLAYGMYFNVTRDPAAEAHLLAVRDLMFNKYFDAAGNRLKDALTYDLSAEVDTNNNGTDIGNYLSAVTSFYLVDTQLLTDPARRAQFAADTRKLTQGLIDNFRATGAQNRWWFWGHTKRFGNLNSPQASFGHNLKAYGLIANANRMFPDRPWEGLAANRATLITRAWDDAAARWNQQPLSLTSTSAEPDSSWWMHDEGDELLATLDLSGGFPFSAQLARASQTFLDVYVDRDPAYPERETFSRVERTGVYTDLKKSAFGKSMLHNFEHALVMYLHGRALEGLPARLFYAFPADQALSAVARPYWFDATGETRKVGDELTNLPGHKIVAVDFTGMDSVPRPPYPAPNDVTPPETTATVSPPANAAGWNRSDVTVSLGAIDDLAGVKEIHATVQSPDGALPSVGYIDPGDVFTLPPIAAEGDFDVSYFAVDALGNAEAAQTLHVRIDKTAPTVTITSPTGGASYLLDELTHASFRCDDEPGGSGLLGCTGAVPVGDLVDTSAVGAHRFTVNGTDQAGNESVLTHEYVVRYGFSGFLSPLDNLPVVNVANAGRTVSVANAGRTVNVANAGRTVNVANAGRTIPVKWRLVNAAGAAVADPTSFVSLTSVPGGCAGSVATDRIETAAMGSGLQYLGDGYWQFDWKTAKSYAGTCRVIRLNLADTAGAATGTLADLGRTAVIEFR